ncbi:outer membrane lipoprotein LolB [Lysobacter sp. H21R4]|uniref:lipoprotein insertase outer membrane protein LolB n=1 Tax=Lysobacter sp. H21R4 TaxID=2781021 RepID=UPI001889AB58|nr:lipoprotein insertase outer membrane protein LolB [Lysobacter sp. H21R4]QOY63149.1 outer membrane lipoprotein LolB [Lysobacter sp. H21R4]
MRISVAVAMSAVGLLLTGCAGAPLRPAIPATDVVAAEAAQLQRESVLAHTPDWSLAGRVAVSNVGKGGSGRIEWRQDGSQYLITLSAPVTRQGWQLAGDADAARLEGLEGGPRSGPDARLLLLAATGWDIPVVALGDWVRGARAPALAPARIEYGTDGLPRRIDQDGWTIEYRWAPDAAAGGQTALPSRVDAFRGEAKVKLIVDEWQSGSVPGTARLP